MTLASKLVNVVPYLSPDVCCSSASVRTIGFSPGVCIDRFFVVAQDDQRGLAIIRQDLGPVGAWNDVGVGAHEAKRHLAIWVGLDRSTSTAAGPVGLRISEAAVGGYNASESHALYASVFRDGTVSLVPHVGP